LPCLTRCLLNPNYICHRCGKPGHYIQHCPTNGDPAFDVRRPRAAMGVQRSFMSSDAPGSYGMADGSSLGMHANE